MSVVEGRPLPVEARADAAVRGARVQAPMPSAAKSTRGDTEQPLLWGQWGGVIVIVAVLVSVVAGLTLTVGAIPL